MLNVYQEPNNPYTLFSANSVDHFSPYPIEKRPVLTEISVVVRSSFSLNFDNDSMRLQLS